MHTFASAQTRKRSRVRKTKSANKISIRLLETNSHKHKLFVKVTMSHGKRAGIFRRRYVERTSYIYRMRFLCCLAYIFQARFKLFLFPCPCHGALHIYIHLNIVWFFRIIFRAWAYILWAHSLSGATYTYLFAVAHFPPGVVPSVVMGTAI